MKLRISSDKLELTITCHKHHALPPTFPNPTDLCFSYQLLIITLSKTRSVMEETFNDASGFIIH